MREANYLSSSNGEVKNTWNYFSLPILFHVVVLNEALGNFYLFIVPLPTLTLICCLVHRMEYLIRYM